MTRYAATRARKRCCDQSRITVRPRNQTLQLFGVGGSLQAICGSLAPGIQMPLTLVFAVERRAKYQTRLSPVILVTLHRSWCFLFGLSVDEELAKYISIFILGKLSLLINDNAVFVSRT
ncbi:hypothetical protein J6590_101259 [Homalodisca vitripennis]|nr:hypothetical protein J6590_101259 [Homalodisca vitripennis]